MGADHLISLFSLASYHRILGWVIGEEMPLIDVTLAFPETFAETGLHDLFSIQPRFHQPQDSFSCAERHLNWPIARKPSEIDDLFALCPFDLLPPDYGTETLSSRVVSAMRASLSMEEGIPDIQTIAQMFGFTPATLRRRLAREDSSLVALRTQCRRELALTMLAGTDLTVREIASRLQYADAATFRRAFVGWTKMNPGDWRAQNAPTDTAVLQAEGIDFP